MLFIFQYQNLNNLSINKNILKDIKNKNMHNFLIF